MMKGFTLLELIIVIIIIGVLATLGFTQYGRMIEKSRMAEAKMIIGHMRELAIAYLLANGTVSGITNADLNVGTSSDQIPSVCKSSHYFRYFVAVAAPDMAFIAVRCSSGGKPPDYANFYSYGDQCNANMTQDTWQCGSGTGWGGIGPCP